MSVRYAARGSPIPKASALVSVATRPADVRRDDGGRWHSLGASGLGVDPILLALSRASRTPSGLRRHGNGEGTTPALARHVSAVVIYRPCATRAKALTALAPATCCITAQRYPAWRSRCSWFAATMRRSFVASFKE